MKSKVASWADLTGKRSSSMIRLPLHVAPEVVGVLDVEETLRLPQRESTLHTLQYAMRWLGWSSSYEAITHLLSQITRKPFYNFDDVDTSTLFDTRKIRLTHDPILACCNGMPREEERDDGNRRRPLFEPLINDLINRPGAPDYLQTTTTYTPKSAIRQRVYEDAWGVQFDFRAWFDQIRLTNRIQPLFGVTTPKGNAVLEVLAMGFRPSCEVANALTTSIAELPSCDPTATIVDNVLYTGTYSASETAARDFLMRCDTVKAVVKDRNPRIQQTYEFCGEAYCHKNKTRALTKKTTAKTAFILELLKRDALTTRQWMSIYGILQYAAGVLRIHLAKYHTAMRFLASLYVGNDWWTPQRLRRRVTPQPEVRAQLHEWASICRTNNPVPVWTPEKEVDLTIYVDASALGWGAVSITPEGEWRTAQQRWKPEHHIGRRLQESVDAEPLAIKLAVAAFVTARAHHHVRIYTDHESLVFAAKKTVGRTASYSHLLQFLDAFTTTTFELLHVNGSLNPADTLSRQFPPQLLQVTRIGQHFVTPFPIATRADNTIPGRGYQG